MQATGLLCKGTVKKFRRYGSWEQTHNEYYAKHLLESNNIIKPGIINKYAPILTALGVLLVLSY